MLDKVAVTLSPFRGGVPFTEVTFAKLPAAPVFGMLANVSDSSTNTWGATVAGSGANHVLARWNGTNWTVVAK